MMTPSLLTQLGRIVGPRWVRHRRAELATYTMDGLPTRESAPGAVVLPGSAAEVREIVAKKLELRWRELKRARSLLELVAVRATAPPKPKAEPETAGQRLRGLRGQVAGPDELAVGVECDLAGDERHPTRDGDGMREPRRRGHLRY